jgi:serine/threonine-protein kinase RsbW
MTLAENDSLRIYSKLEDMIQVEKMIDDVCASTKVSDDAYGNILVALTEAVNNAIYHGNKADASKKIDISFSTTDTTVTFIIKDEGAGFDYDSLPDPTDPANIENPNGRGVFLMRSLADKVSFEDNGSKVILEFNT